jgi:hypothetical protein
MSCHVMHEGSLAWFRLLSRDYPHNPYPSAPRTTHKESYRRRHLIRLNNLNDASSSLLYNLHIHGISLSATSNSTVTIRPVTRNNRFSASSKAKDSEFWKAALPVEMGPDDFYCCIASRIFNDPFEFKYARRFLISRIYVSVLNLLNTISSNKVLFCLGVVPA